jgi:CO dehydrogenase maturation factor
VINKVSSEVEEKFVTEKLAEMGVDVLGSIPRDDLVVRADMEGRPLVDYPDSAALQAVEKIAGNILNHSDPN